MVTRGVPTRGLTVWAGIHTASVIITCETVHGERCLQMQEKQFWPAINLFSSKMERQLTGQEPFETGWTSRWIGRRGNSLEWPPRSPHLTVCHYFLWGYIKNKDFETLISNLDELSQLIMEQFHDLRLQPDILYGACQTLPIFFTCLLYTSPSPRD